MIFEIKKSANKIVNEKITTVTKVIIVAM